jgi:hypothetical protein
MPAGAGATQESHHSPICPSVDDCCTSAVGQRGQLCEQRLETLALLAAQPARGTHANDGGYRSSEAEFGQCVRQAALMLNAHRSHGPILQMPDIRTPTQRRPRRSGASTP